MEIAHITTRLVHDLLPRVRARRFASAWHITLPTASITGSQIGVNLCDHGFAERQFFLLLFQVILGLDDQHLVDIHLGLPGFTAGLVLRFAQQTLGNHHFITVSYTHLTLPTTYSV